MTITSTVTQTLTYMFFIMLSAQECGCDGICGTGALGEMGPFQINPGVAAGQMNKLGYDLAEDEWWSFSKAMPAAGGFLMWNYDTQYCEEFEWALAAYNWGIGNVRRFQDKHGCDLAILQARHPHVYSFAMLERGRHCWAERRDDWRQQEYNPARPTDPKDERSQGYGIEYQRGSDGDYSRAIPIVLGGEDRGVYPLTNPGPHSGYGGESRSREATVSARGSFQIQVSRADQNGDCERDELPVVHHAPRLRLHDPLTEANGRESCRGIWTGFVQLDRRGWE